MNGVEDIKGLPALITQAKHNISTFDLADEGCNHRLLAVICIIGSTENMTRRNFATVINVYGLECLNRMSVQEFFEQASEDSVDAEGEALMYFKHLVMLP